MIKPKMRPITIEIDKTLPRALVIETLTDEAAKWIATHAPEFGRLNKTGLPKEFHLWVYRGFNCDEVAAYLNELWDAQQWPEEITTSPADTAPPACES